MLVCRQIRPETHDVKTFVLEARRPQLFHYRPGQFLTFDFEIDGERINRCYTISSTPTRPHLISITTKRVPGGPVSNWLHDRLKPGMELRATGPMGEFTSLAHPAEKYLFLSGGSGITPLMSMARAYHDLVLPRDIVFVHFARTPADIIFRAELELMARNLPSFRFVPVCESDSPGERWAGFSGRVSPPLLRLIAPDFLEREVMVCGPAPFMAAVRGILAGAEFDMARHHEESFDFATQESGGTEEERRPRRRRRSRSSSGRAAAWWSAVPTASCSARPRRPGCGCRPPAPRACAAPARAGSLSGEVAHEAPGRHPPARDRPGDGPDLLLEAAHRPRRRSLTPKGAWTERC